MKQGEIEREIERESERRWRSQWDSLGERARGFQRESYCITWKFNGPGKYQMML